MHCENGPEKGVKSRIVHGFLWWVPVFYAEEGTCFWHSGGCIPPLPMCDRLVYFKFLRHLKYLSLSTQFWASIFLVSVFHGLNLCVSMFHASVFHYSVFRFSIFRASVFREPNHFIWQVQWATEISFKFPYVQPLPKQHRLSTYLTFIFCSSTMFFQTTLFAPLIFSPVSICP